jgi:hypothetical protein
MWLRVPTLKSYSRAVSLKCASYCCVLLSPPAANCYQKMRITKTNKGPALLFLEELLLAQTPAR